ncbi:MAG: YlbE-like family protein [Bacilli bacterium]|jgi:6-phosphogluconate dehydrogenase|nr:YlbE-like family protein [Bacilli bacterium]
MNLDIQFKIKANPNYQRYLRENSHWYKILNRHPEQFNYFAEEMKERYKLRTTDKIDDFLEKIKLVRKFMNIIS